MNRQFKLFKKKKKACAYARVSTYSEAQGDSLENQIAYYENLIYTNPEYEFAGVLADKGITGTKENRPEFQKILELARQGQIDVILTKSISRFARNTAVMLKVVRELKDIGVEVKFEKENISTLSGDGELMLTVLSSFAQEESKNVSDNVKWRYRKKFENGELVINTNRFLGFDKDAYGDLVINQCEAEIIKRIFSEYLCGKGISKIAKLLNIEGVPTVTGAKWHEASVRDILKNEKYKGDVILQKTFTENHLSKRKKRNKGEVDSFYILENHSPIVTREMWESVQTEMQKRAEEKGLLKDPQKCQNRYPLSGMLFCSICGAVLRRRTWNRKHTCRKIIWQCSNYIKNGKNACKGTTVADDIVSKLKITEQTVVKEIIKNGQKHYSYSSKREHIQSYGSHGAKKKENGSILQGVNRRFRTIIQL